MDWQMIERFGFPIAYSVVVSGFLGWLIKYVLTETAKEKKLLREIITNHVAHNTEAMNKLVQTLEGFQKNVERAHDYQREEHKEIMKILVKQ